MAKQDVQETQQEEVAATEEPKITMADIANSLRIIDSAIERGAFRGKEVSTVGATRDKLESFVEFQEEQQRKIEEDEENQTEEKSAKK